MVLPAAPVCVVEKAVSLQNLCVLLVILTGPFWEPRSSGPGSSCALNHICSAATSSVQSSASTSGVVSSQVTSLQQLLTSPTQQLTAHSVEPVSEVSLAFLACASHKFIVAGFAPLSSYRSLVRHPASVSQNYGSTCTLGPVLLQQFFAMTIMGSGEVSQMC